MFRLLPQGAHEEFTSAAILQVLCLSLANQQDVNKRLPFLSPRICHVLTRAEDPCVLQGRRQATGFPPAQGSLCTDARERSMAVGSAPLVWPPPPDQADQGSACSELGAVCTPLLLSAKAFRLQSGLEYGRVSPLAFVPSSVGAPITETILAATTSPHILPGSAVQIC